jgi:hypothetical protein
MAVTKRRAATVEAAQQRRRAGEQDGFLAAYRALCKRRGVCLVAGTQGGLSAYTIKGRGLAAYVDDIQVTGKELY